MTIDALQWLSSREAREGSYMFGVESFYDGPCAMDYDPWVHAEELGVPVVVNDRLPLHAKVAAYSRRRDAIFVRPNLTYAVERCGVAHELVHREHGDVGTTSFQEDRADRTAARRLIRPRRLEALDRLTDDPAVVALELDVTERIMRFYMRMVRQGTVYANA